MDTNKIIAQSIASEYAPKEESKVVALKKLDRKAKLPAKVFAYTFGIISSLVLGIGMSLAMKVIGNTDFHFVLGIVFGTVGLIGVSVNYLLYDKILASSKRRYASDIITLAKEISEE